MKSTQKLIPAAVAFLGMAALSACSGTEDGSTGTASSSVVVTSIQSSETPSTSVETVTATDPASNEQPAPERQAAGGCDPADFQAAGFSSITHVAFCDGQWATGGQAQTDSVNHFRFVGSSWTKIEHAGETPTGFRCYDRVWLGEQGAPAGFVDNVMACPESQGSDEKVLPGTQCKSYDFGPLVVKEGEISCAEAIRVMDYYLDHVSEGTGNIAALAFEDWRCATNTAGIAGDTGWSLGCDRADGVDIGVRAS